jgi:hypothetical protein
MRMFTLADAIEKVSLWVALGGVGVIWIIAATIQSILSTSMKERSRREIAAYIAEGSMSPEQGERLMNAGKADEEDA